MLGVLADFKVAHRSTDAFFPSKQLGCYSAFNPSQCKQLDCYLLLVKSARLIHSGKLISVQTVKLVLSFHCQKLA
jgi:hypothetical protein